MPLSINTSSSSSLRSAVVAVIIILCLLVSRSPLLASTFVRFDTTLGVIDFQLFDAEMPVSTANFLSYVTTDRYDGSFVHVATPEGAEIGIIQGGGFYFSVANGLTSVPGNPPILDEPGGGVAGPSNLRGTISFAKRGPDTVVSQWFINTQDNSSLDDPQGPSGGFSAFGRVLNDGMAVADEIANLSLIDLTQGDPGSPFASVPLVNFTGNPVDESNLVIISEAMVFEPLPGDFNIDGVVDAEDLATLQLNLGKATGAFFDEGDSDMDGDVDGIDLLTWQRNFAATEGATSFAASVPEPFALTLLTVGVLAIAARWRTKPGLGD